MWEMIYGRGCIFKYIACDVCTCEYVLSMCACACECIHVCVWVDV